LGPNGVGKTTLVKCINKLLVPVAGTVELNGKDVHKMGFHEMAQHMAYVPKSSGNVFSMSVTETILMGRHPRAGWITTDEDLDAVIKAIKVLGLSEYSSRDVRALSAGQVQRVMIARGLVQEPEVLILDEPTSNLDVKYQMGVMKFLKAYARDKGIIVIMVCHDLNITAAYADRVVLVYNKGVFADGTAKEVLTAENIEEVYKVEAQVSEVNGIPHIFLVPEFE
jgi:iron complex transport system ATP-binding protein